MSETVLTQHIWDCGTTICLRQCYHIMSGTIVPQYPGQWYHNMSGTVVPQHVWNNVTTTCLGQLPPGLEIFLRTYSSFGASCKQFSLVLNAGALVLKIWISKNHQRLMSPCFDILSTFDIKMEILDYLTFGVSRFITWR